MSEFDRVAFVWGTMEGGGAPLAEPPSISAAMWPHALGCDLLRWAPGQMPDISKYDLFLVNLFHTGDSTHITQIKQARPDAVVVAMPDPPVDMVLEHADWMRMWTQMAFADIIGGRTPYDNAVYGTFFNKPTVWLPSPAGPTEYFAQYRDVEKEDYIITLDRWGSAMTGQNVAALAAIQRETGLRVIYARPHEHTKHLANLAGLKAEFREPNIPWLEMIEVTAKARLCVDIYARHSYGRQGVLCALVGTPYVGSKWTNYTGLLGVDPFRPEESVDMWDSISTLKRPWAYDRCRLEGFDIVDRVLSFEAARRRIRGLIDTLPRRKQNSSPQQQGGETA
jgi:hypothetical protein